jgi:hypothetical protein
MDKAPFEPAGKMQPADVLKQLGDVFKNKGWMNQIVRIRYRDKKYRLLCNEKTFIAYRINENYGIAPGMPGWAVCFVDCNQVLEDARMPNPVDDEPCVQDWLQCLSQDEFEII